MGGKFYKTFSSPFIIKMCRQCKLKIVYEFTNKRKLCSRCFVNWFEKKFFYIIRKFRLIRQGDVVSYKAGSNFWEVVLEEILKKFSERTMIKIVKNSSKATKIAIASTIDSEADEIIHELIKGNANLKKAAPIEKIKKKIFIKPLYLFLDSEVLLYAKIKRLKFKEKIKYKDKISKFIDSLEEKHPEVKRAVVNSYLGMYE